MVESHNVKDNFVNVATAADVLGVSVSTIYRFIKRKKLRATQSTGEAYGKWMIVREDVEGMYKDVLKPSGEGTERKEETNQ